MSAQSDQVEAVLRRLGAAGTVRTFDQEVPTAAAAAERLGCDVGAIANSLVFVAGDEPLLVLTSGAHRVDTGHLARLLGVAKIRRASPERVLEATGQQVGGVAPVGHPAPLRTVVDVWLEKYDVVWAGAGDHLSMFPTSFAELVRLTGGQPAHVSP
ncbi:YbaK/EbsC family protein [Actinopolymorpha pittospori]|uniref:Prolyl-tRNA editing enzyme YbaK/EbsC (Cys-tRNA(Pro) deacylase) n=1 Tax=Actinopolymorpha pittospori TaxID=648752 RepID=A0A927N915_9ACTN|nr:YbaK/EbsC family protein [Actinopolymorpha pittospori]MBE1610585.1 prolyl-tRNA editing enzyme YbaK/EbsC (Cys-tRNA(Pro) deacylase) [Actinopolymorpha pittospori]